MCAADGEVTLLLKAMKNGDESASEKLLRRLLVDHARAHNAERRSGGADRVEFGEGLMVSIEHSAEVLALHDALIGLEGVDSRQGKVVELRYFGGFSVAEIGEILGMSPRSVKRHWALARIWLLKQMNKVRDPDTAQEKGVL